jgi:hypothetical protein
VTNPLIHHDETTGWVRGALILQPPLCAQLSHILHSSAQELWESTTETDYATMWQAARDAASRILAATDPYAVAAGTLDRTINLHLPPELTHLIAKIAAAAIGEGETSGS